MKTPVDQKQNAAASNNDGPKYPDFEVFPAGRLENLQFIAHIDGVDLYAKYHDKDLAAYYWVSINRVISFAAQQAFSDRRKIIFGWPDNDIPLSVREFLQTYHKLTTADS